MSNDKFKSFPMKSLNIPLGKESSVLFPVPQRNLFNCFSGKCCKAVSSTWTGTKTSHSQTHCSVKREGVYLSTLSVSSRVLHSLLNSGPTEFSGLMLDLSIAQWLSERRYNRLNSFKLSRIQNLSAPFCCNYYFAVVTQPLLPTFLRWWSDAHSPTSTKHHLLCPTAFN